MPESGRTRFLSFVGSHLLTCVLCVQVAFTVAILTMLGSGHLGSLESHALRGLLGSVAGCLILVAFYTAWRDRRARRGERSRAHGLSDRMEVVLNFRREWWWALDESGTFTFSSSASLDLLGYAPSELEGQPVSMVIDLDDLAKARQSVAAALAPDGSSWAGVVVRCRRRDGSPVWMRYPDTRARPSSVPAQDSKEPAEHFAPKPPGCWLLSASGNGSSKCCQEKCSSRPSNPSHELATGTVIGVEALARFSATTAAARNIGFPRPPPSAWRRTGVRRPGSSTARPRRGSRPPVRGP